MAEVAEYEPLSIKFRVALVPKKPRTKTRKIIFPTFVSILAHDVMKKSVLQSHYSLNSVCFRE